MTRNTAQLLLALLFALLMLAYGATWLTLHELWRQINFSYSHGYLLLAASVWLIYERLAQRDYPLVMPAYSVLLLLALCSLLWLAAYATQVMVIQQALLPCIIACWFAAVFGWRVARSLFFPIVILFFAIPLWDFLILPLREIAVVVTQTVLDWLAIPALVDGFNIHVPVGTFVVAGGCSGLNYLLTGLVVGTLYAYMNLSSWWRRVIVVALVIALALLGNWVRIIALVLIGYATDMESSLVREHGSFGWVVFALAMGLFFLLVRWIKRGDRAPQRPRVDSVPVNWRQVVTAGVLATTAGLVFPGWGYWQQWQAVEGGALTVNVDPVTWQAIEPDWMPAYRGYDNVLAWRERGANDPLDVLMLIYRQQSQGKELISDLNRIAYEPQALSAVSQLDISDDLWVNQQLIRIPLEAENGLRRSDYRVVWWYYRVAGQPVIGDAEGKLLQLRALFSGDATAALVAVSMPCAPAQCERDAERMVTSPRLLQALRLAQTD